MIINTIKSVQIMTDETLRAVSTCFLACVPVVEVRKLLDAVPRELLTEEFQELLIGCTILHPTATAFPPRTAYIRNFLKCLINKLETENIEIADILYVHFAGKLGSASGEEDIPGFVTYTIDDRTMVTLKEHTAVVINGTTGLRTWQASKFLSEWCLENRHLLRNKCIVELGCGVGLTGMVVCKTCCPLSYTFTDGHEAVLQSVEENLRLNSVTECHTRAEMLRWGDHEDFREHCTAGVILGADLVFDPAVVPALVATLAALLAHGGTAYIASTVRNLETRALFLSKLGTLNKFRRVDCRQKLFGQLRWKSVSY
ncbi:protein-lysine N-methyltransferase EEF2KMT isoform X3 [Dermacentor andersoni]|uniref:protein-lysine N-methyltransferase EEF2KMT isoform X3 n=1 Tax=Dermacentor andersoni TaxID=34620 RepID=UPI003B3AD68A